MRYFEDFDVGDRYEFGSHTVTQQELISFAEQFDPQPFHVDPAAAKDTHFGGIVASGLHTLCLATRLTVDHFLDEVAAMGGFGMDDLRWHQPVRAGDTLSVLLEVAETRPSTTKSDRGYVDFERAVLNQNDDVVMSVVVHNIVRRRTADE